MAHITIRWDGNGQWYFVTVVTLRRHPVFAQESACSLLQAAFREARRFLIFRLAGLVILPDHWHAVIRPGPSPLTGCVRNLSPQDSSVTIERVVGAVKRNVLRGIRKKESTLWQPRFLDHRIRDEDDFRNHLEYIRLNPVKHGIVSDPDQYPWCFIHPNPFQ